MKSSYRIIKLRSGEELIATIKGQSKGKYILERPMLFESVVIHSPMGDKKEITTLSNWIGFSDDISAKVPKDYIAVFLNPSSETSKLYDLEKEREDTSNIERKVKKTPFNNPNDYKNLDMDYINELMDSLTEEPPMLPFEDMMDNPLDNLFSEEQSDMPNVPDEKDMKDFIAMTLFFPPEILNTFVENGIIDPKVLEDMQEFGKMNLNENLNEKFDENKRKDADDYGMHWEDWSPYVEDYIEDEDDDDDQSLDPDQ